MTVEQKIVDIMVQNLIEAGVPTFQGGGLVTANKEPPFSRAGDRKSTRLNSSHVRTSRMPSSA